MSEIKKMGLTDFVSGIKHFVSGIPHFNYCAETWNFCSKGATTKLEKLNERALRFVYRDYSSSYEMLLKQSGYQTVVKSEIGKDTDYCIQSS